MPKLTNIPIDEYLNGTKPKEGDVVGKKVSKMIKNSTDMPEDILEKYKKLKKKIMNRGGKSKNQMNVLKKQLTVVMAQLEASGMPGAELNEMKKEVRHLESHIKMDERIKIIKERIWLQLLEEKLKEDEEDRLAMLEEQERFSEFIEDLVDGTEEREELAAARKAEEDYYRALHYRQNLLNQIAGLREENVRLGEQRDEYIRIQKELRHEQDQILARLEAGALARKGLGELGEGKYGDLLYDILPSIVKSCFSKDLFEDVNEFLEDFQQEFETQLVDKGLSQDEIVQVASQARDEYKKANKEEIETLAKGNKHYNEIQVLKEEVVDHIEVNDKIIEDIKEDVDSFEEVVTLVQEEFEERIEVLEEKKRELLSENGAQSWQKKGSSAQKDLVSKDAPSKETPSKASRPAKLKALILQSKILDNFITRKTTSFLLYGKKKQAEPNNPAITLESTKKELGVEAHAKVEQEEKAKLEKLIKELPEKIAADEKELEKMDKQIEDLQKEIVTITEDIEFADSEDEVKELEERKSSKAKELEKIEKVSNVLNDQTDKSKKQLKDAKSQLEDFKIPSEAEVLKDIKENKDNKLSQDNNYPEDNGPDNNLGPKV